MRRNEKIIYFSIAVLLLIISTSTVTYALWAVNFTQEATNNVTTACFDVAMTEGSTINLTNAYPISDEAGKKSLGYTVTFTNKCTSKVNYDLIFTLDSTSNLPTNKVKYYVESTNNQNSGPNFLNSPTNGSNYSLATGTLSAASSSGGTGDSVTYTVRFWVDSSVETKDNLMNKTFKGKFNPHFVAVS